MVLLINAENSMYRKTRKFKKKKKNTDTYTQKETVEMSRTHNKEIRPRKINTHWIY